MFVTVIHATVYGNLLESAHGFSLILVTLSCHALIFDVNRMLSFELRFVIR